MGAGLCAALARGRARAAAGLFAQPLHRLPPCRCWRGRAASQSARWSGRSAPRRTCPRPSALGCWASSRWRPWQTHARWRRARRLRRAEMHRPLQTVRCTEGVVEFRGLVRVWTRVGWRRARPVQTSPSANGVLREGLVVCRVCESGCTCAHARAAHPARSVWGSIAEGRGRGECMAVEARCGRVQQQRKTIMAIIIRLLASFGLWIKPCKCPAIRVAKCPHKRLFLLMNILALHLRSLSCARSCASASVC